MDERTTGQAAHQTSRAGRIIPIVLTIVIFLVIFWRIPFHEFALAISKARLAPFLTLMACFSICFFLMDTFVLSRMIRWFHGPLTFPTLLPVRAVTYVVSIINTQLAQVALALYFHRRFSTPLAEITSTVATLILLEVTNLLSFATIGLLAFPGGAPPVLFALPVGLAAFWLLITRVARGGLGALGRKIGSHTLLQTFRAIRPGQVLIVLALKGSVFLLSLFVHKYALTLFGIDIPLIRLLTFLPLVFMIGALPVTVAHLGTSQAAWIFFFQDYAAEADLLAYSLVSHLTFMLANGTIGLLFMPKAYADLFGKGRASAVRV